MSTPPETTIGTLVSLDTGTTSSLTPSASAIALANTHDEPRYSSPVPRLVAEYPGECRRDADLERAALQDRVDALALAGLRHAGRSRLCDGGTDARGKHHRRKARRDDPVNPGIPQGAHDVSP